MVSVNILFKKSYTHIHNNTNNDLMVKLWKYIALTGNMLVFVAWGRRKKILHETDSFNKEQKEILNLVLINITRYKVRNNAKYFYKCE